LLSGTLIPARLVSIGRLIFTQCLLLIDRTEDRRSLELRNCRELVRSGTNVGELRHFAQSYVGRRPISKKDRASNTEVWGTGPLRPTWSSTGVAPRNSMDCRGRCDSQMRANERRLIREISKSARRLFSAASKKKRTASRLSAAGGEATRSRPLQQPCDTASGRKRGRVACSKN
jgi:hypothetical protein